MTGTKNTTYSTPAKAVTTNYSSADNAIDYEEEITLPTANDLIASQSYSASSGSQGSGWSFRSFLNKFMGSDQDPNKTPLLSSESGFDEESIRPSSSEIFTNNSSDIIKPGSPDSLTSVRASGSPPRSASLITARLNGASFSGENRILHAPLVRSEQGFKLHDRFSENATVSLSSTSSDSSNESTRSLKDPVDESEYFAPVDSNLISQPEERNEGLWAAFKHWVWPEDKNTLENAVLDKSFDSNTGKALRAEQLISDKFKGSNLHPIFAAGDNAVKMNSLSEQNKKFIGEFYSPEDNSEAFPTVPIINQRRPEVILSFREKALRGLSSVVEATRSASTMMLCTLSLLRLAHEEGFQDELEGETTLETVRISLLVFTVLNVAVYAYGQYVQGKATDRYKDSFFTRPERELISQPRAAQRIENASHFMQAAYDTIIFVESTLVIPFGITDSRGAYFGILLADVLIGGAIAMLLRSLKNKRREQLSRVKQKNLSGNFSPRVFGTKEIFSQVGPHVLNTMGLVNVSIHVCLLPGYGNLSVTAGMLLGAALFESILGVTNIKSPNAAPRAYYLYQAFRNSFRDAIIIALGYVLFTTEVVLSEQNEEYQKNARQESYAPNFVAPLIIALSLASNFYKIGGYQSYLNGIKRDQPMIEAKSAAFSQLQPEDEVTEVHFPLEEGGFLCVAPK